MVVVLLNHLVWIEAIVQDIMNSLNVERFLDLGVRSHSHEEDYYQKDAGIEDPDLGHGCGEDIFSVRVRKIQIAKFGSVLSWKTYPN